MDGISCDVYTGADDPILINVMKGGGMARFLIGTIPVVEHVSPVMAITRELVNQGHEVFGLIL